MDEEELTCPICLGFGFKTCRGSVIQTLYKRWMNELFSKPIKIYSKHLYEWPIVVVIIFVIRALLQIYEKKTNGHAPNVEQFKQKLLTV